MNDLAIVALALIGADVVKTIIKAVFGDANE